ncbi:MAG: amidohydrolase family protein [Oscillospiraceae bacterium]|nr:amidohydrolase family protein [Oscillospiraceae bacterium]
MRRIDLENHFYDQSLIEALAARKEPPYYDRAADIIHWTHDIPMPQGKLLDVLLDVSQQRLAVYDRVGIDRAVLSSSSGPEQLDPEVSIQVCRATNDAIAALIRAHPDRFSGSAILPVKTVETACAELERCVKELGFVAWHTHSNYGPTAPDQPQYRPLFQTAADLGVYVYLHPQLPETARMEGLGFAFAGPSLGFTVDTMTTLMRMILSGLFDEIPNLKVVLGHLGEGLPFLLERIDNRTRFVKSDKIRCEHDVSYYFKKNIWVTTSGNMSAEAFACTKAVLGIDRMLFGSDYPFEVADDMMTFLDHVPMTQVERSQLFCDNAVNQLAVPG